MEKTTDHTDHGPQWVGGAWRVLAHLVIFKFIYAYNL
jgi:hypothetical protein